MKIKRKNSRRSKPEEKAAVPEVTAPIPDMPAGEMFTANDLNAVPLDDKPKRKYTKRGSTETAGFQFGDLTVFAGELAAKLSSVITKQEAPLNSTEKQMLKTVGDTCGKFLMDGVDMETVAPKYAKVAVVGMLGLVVGVRALDFFMRPRLSAGQPASVSYDLATEQGDMPVMPDIQG